MIALGAVEWGMWHLIALFVIGVSLGICAALVFTRERDETKW